ncbi:MAG: keto-deoxy-phosphogluconate aldolase [Pseudomonadota bacterium]
MAETTSLISALSAVPILPELIIERLEDAAQLAMALERGGAKAATVRLGTPAALAALPVMRDASANIMVGASGIVSSEDVATAVGAGAEFLLSPGVSPSLGDAMLNAAVPAMPGIGTVSEALTRISEGFEVLGVMATTADARAFLTTLATCLPSVQIVASGSLDMNIATEHLAVPNVLAVSGTWMVRSSDVAIGDWVGVEQTIKLAITRMGIS